jgi:uncharacterized coiled-coil protein SlyX
VVVQLEHRTTMQHTNEDAVNAQIADVQAQIDQLRTQLARL